ncbi:uncharacterized protein CELE_F39E9.14 [Caenorhabditis elegans]|uniref:Uncharacterized protein n=1 Tax=Caenorhabditis elegans TaxID=6239 RepID=Q4W514_CAEEL|nr:Uncharacterized protein CELE_F39E9.14 [Caenorhabditis elegans]CCD68919.1 Uncharacterized protein CELE_F39E9.14 [Caenorhabditis elegans]|eukprot:NP_001022149.1 Uncharacterized protein CELE_F39E9.14 [Caenorhabditis elegans]
MDAEEEPEVGEDEERRRMVDGVIASGMSGCAESKFMFKNIFLFVNLRAQTNT